MNNTGIILVLAYPETIVRVSEEWFSPFLRFIGIGKKNYLKAGHAALVLINKSTGILEYHDFGRYITSEPNARARGGKYDRDLEFPLIADVQQGEIRNLDEILIYLANNPKLTHGDGKLIASVCDEVNYEKARTHIDEVQSVGEIRYAAFLNNASNCARFVTNTLISSVTNSKIKKELKKSKRFTPSTVGNCVIAKTKHITFEVENEEIREHHENTFKENFKNFLDRLKSHKVNFKGTLKPKGGEHLTEHSHWLPGIASGAWFNIINDEKLVDNELRIQRISPYNTIDSDCIYTCEISGFNVDEDYVVKHPSNCYYIHLEQNDEIFRFNFKKDFNS